MTFVLNTSIDNAAFLDSFVERKAIITTCAVMLLLNFNDGHLHHSTLLFAMQHKCNMLHKHSFYKLGNIFYCQFNTHYVQLCYESELSREYLVKSLKRAS